MPPKKHLLVIRLSAMGDVAMTVPVIRALLAQHDNVRVTVVSRPQFRPFFEGIDNVVFFGADTKKSYKGIFGIWKLYKDLRKLHVYAVADLHNVLRSSIITKLFKQRGKQTATLDKARAAKKALTRHTNKVFEQLRPVTERYADVFRQLGFAVDLSSPAFPEKPALTQDIQELMGSHGRPWIGIAPFAKHRGKIYPSDLMKEVVARLAAGNVQIVLFGAGREETATLKQLAENQSNVAVAAGALSLKQELKLIANLDVMLSMDSGNGHMAAIFGVPVLTLWGATHPFAGFAPFNQPIQNALTADRAQYPMLPTSVYGNKKVKGYEDVMRTIAPETVVSTILEIIEPKKAGI